MYRYTSQNRFNYVMKSNRLRPILMILALVVIVIAVVKFAGGNGLNESNFVNQRNARIRNEMQHAMNQINSLSRLGATSTGGTLGRVRQYIHGVEVLNELNVSMYGEVGRLYLQNTFDQIYSIIEDYEAKLASGQKVNDSLALLTEAVSAMNDITVNKVLVQP